MKSPLNASTRCSKLANLKEVVLLPLSKSRKIAKYLVIDSHNVDSHNVHNQYHIFYIASHCMLHNITGCYRG